MKVSLLEILSKVIHFLKCLVKYDTCPISYGCITHSVAKTLFMYTRHANRDGSKTLTSDLI